MYGFFLEGAAMARKNYKREEIASKLRQANVLITQDARIPDVVGARMEPVLLLEIRTDGLNQKQYGKPPHSSYRHRHSPRWRLEKRLRCSDTF
jgi:hypothetical protein